MIKNTILGCTLLITMLFGWPALTADDPNIDPFDNLNRKIYGFNDVADRIVLAPVARGYQMVTPQFLDDGVTNVFANLNDMSSAINGLLQLSLDTAAVGTGRFLLNTTVGVLGFFDIATTIGLNRDEADFGQTLAVWGAASGPYIMLPILGPATVRSGLGKAVDGQWSWISHVDHVPTRNASYAGNIIDGRADLLRAEELITGDRYIFIRDAFLQKRHFLVNGEVVDDFGDEDFDWDE